MPILIEEAFQFLYGDGERLAGWFRDPEELVCLAQQTFPVSLTAWSSGGWLLRCSGLKMSCRRSCLMGCLRKYSFRMKSCETVETVFRLGTGFGAASVFRMPAYACSKPEAPFTSC